MVKVDLSGVSAFFDPAELAPISASETESLLTKPAQAVILPAGWSFPSG